MHARDTPARAAVIHCQGPQPLQLLHCMAMVMLLTSARFAIRAAGAAQCASQHRLDSRAGAQHATSPVRLTRCEPLQCDY